MYIIIQRNKAGKTFCNAFPALSATASLPGGNTKPGGKTSAQNHNIARRAALGHFRRFLAAFKKGLAHIQPAITGPVFHNIRLTVGAGADDVHIQFTLAIGQATGASHVTVARLVHQQTFQQRQGYLVHVRIKIIALGLLDGTQQGIQAFRGLAGLVTHRRTPRQSVFWKNQ